MSQALTHEMVFLKMPVVHMEDRQRQSTGICLRLGLGAIEVFLPNPPSGRFSWLEFILPDTGYRVKVLGECANVIKNENGYSVLFKYKHIFPRDRTALSALFTATHVA
jgi:hypothetical protein